MNEPKQKIQEESYRMDLAYFALLNQQANKGDTPIQMHHVVAYENYLSRTYQKPLDTIRAESTQQHLIGELERLVKYNDNR